MASIDLRDAYLHIPNRLSIPKMSKIGGKHGKRGRAPPIQSPPLRPFLGSENIYKGYGKGSSVTEPTVTVCFGRDCARASHRQTMGQKILETRDKLALR